MDQNSTGSLKSVGSSTKPKSKQLSKTAKRDHGHDRTRVNRNSDRASSHRNDHCNHGHGPSNDSDELDEETVHFNKIVDTFLYYQRHAELKLASKIKSIRSIPAAHLSMIPKFRDHIRSVHRCVIANYAFLKSVISATGHIFENRSTTGDHGDQRDREPTASDFNMDKLQSTLRQIVRDWSQEGQAERDQCYKQILDQLIDFWPIDSDRRRIRVLVPGAGLGRLAFNIAQLGFECQGNEFSLFMLFVSNFILNQCKIENEWKIFPYIHQWTNNWTYDDQIRSIQFPDVNPADTPPENFSMTAGDFLDIYGGRKAEDDMNEKRKESGIDISATRSDQEESIDNQEISESDRDPRHECHDEKWDCVVTVFFMDTSHNVIDYLQTIYKILKPNGYWINLGPLLYHYSDIENEISIELPYEEILEISKKLGFEILANEKKLQTSYSQNASSMLQYQYSCAYTIFRKLP